MSSIKKVKFESDRRTNRRRPAFIVGSAVTVQGSKSVVVEDLSIAGARLRGRDLPVAGKQVLVWIDGLDVLGSVAWSRFGEGGVVFDSALDALELTSLEEQARETALSVS